LKKLKATHVEQLALALDPAPAAAPPSARDREARIRRAFDGNALVHYQLRRARRRTIGFQIDDAGLTVSAPRWITLREIEEAIAEKSGWIRKKQAEWTAWRERQPIPRIVFGNGAVLPFLGTKITVRLCEAGATARVADELHLALPPHAGGEQVRDAVQAWLQSQAALVFAERIARFSARICPRFAGWRLSSARSQWGSCTHDGRVRLNWRLVHFSIPVIDYVIAHELAHLQELNHSPRFWRAVGELLPGFEPARDKIKGVDITSLPL
jgi:predicted metal-dependent hydrolase